MGNKFCCCAKPKEKSYPPGAAPRKCGKSSKHGKSHFGGKRSTTVDVAETISSEVIDGCLNDAVGIEQLFKAHDSTEVNNTSDSCESQIGIDNDIIDEFVTRTEVEDADCEVSIDLVTLEREHECQLKADTQSIVEIISSTVEKTEDASPTKNEVQSVAEIASATFETGGASQQKTDIRAVVETNVSVTSESQTEIASKEKRDAQPVLHRNVATVEKTDCASHKEIDVKSDTDIEVAARETSSACQQTDVINVADATSQQKICVETATPERVVNMLDAEHVEHFDKEASSETNTEVNNKDTQNPEADNKEVRKPTQESSGEKPQHGGQLEKKCLDSNTTNKVVVDRKVGGKTVLNDKVQVDKLVFGHTEHENMRLACLNFMKSLNLPVSMLPSGNLSIRKTESASVIQPMLRKARLGQQINETISQTMCLSTASNLNLTAAQKEAVNEEISPTVSPCDSGTNTTSVPKKVSDYPVPKMVYVSPYKLNTFKKRPKHMYAIPAVAKPDVSCKEDIRWTQVESSNPQAQLPWICHSPRFDVAFPPLGKRLFKRMGSIAAMQKKKVIPQTRNIEILKLEENRFPGLRVGALRKGRDKYSFELPKTDTNLDEQYG